MAKVTDAQMKENAKMEVFGNLTEVLEKMSAEQVSNFTFAIPTVQEGQEIWVEINLTAKQWKPTKVSQAYDPFEKTRIWKEKQAMTVAEKAQKFAEKNAKIKRDTDAREKAKETEKPLKAQAGSIGGEMVKKMIEAYERQN